eukprot:TRINITY_DN6842_c0_g1_i3.p1 TRINITY_DN6842_c0_g1~~TRINITY_DN6842_c0_g1_i3.p1  ORF type:complete len:237 (+),score=46.02 TRINITY_DN6842_c0_g1_i3:74-712(+)
MENHRDVLYKVLVVGDIGTGKTCLIRRYVHGAFSMNYRATVGVDFSMKVVEWDENTCVRLQFWDIAGQERFGSMTRVYFKDAYAAFVVFDVTRVSTFEAVKKWKYDIDSKVTIPGTDDPIPVILLANKIDLVSQEGDRKGWGKSGAELDAFCNEHGFLSWFETSAKDNLNIEAASNALMRALLERKEEVKDDHKEPFPSPPKEEPPSSCCGS